MKELSTEEKAELYDKALERAKNTIEVNQAVPDIVECVESLFPELIENEDEEIRKEITEFFKNYSEKGTWKAIPDVKKWIDWLEKQGEPKPVCKMQVSDELYEHIRNTCACIDDALSSKSFADINDYLSMAERSAQSAFDMIEKQSGQKSTDNVEPKFKAGDWVIYNNDICQIVKREEGCNKLITVFGIEKELVNERNLSTARLWTIQDAKDGDVLVNNFNVIFIFKNIKKDTVISYCSIIDRTSDAIVNNFNEVEVGYISVAKFYPATKEQCDTLFAKMKEAGYWWDIEKKELKKIVVPIFNIGDTIAKKHNSDIHDFGSFTITDITGGKYWYNDRIICDISEQDEWEIYEPVRQNSFVWSKEDEEMLNDIIMCGERHCYLDVGNITWLKLLKEKYTWKPSDEQMDMLRIAVATSNSIVLYSLYNDLEKLKG